MSFASKVRRYTLTTFSRPADATAYSAGDEISNSAAAGSVVRPTVDLSFVRKARIVRAGIAVTPASGNLVITAFDFALLVFKTKDVPAAVGDNVAFNVTALKRSLAAKFVFANGAWTAPNGGVAAGTDGFQEVLSAVSGASGAIPGNVFDFTAGDANTAVGRQLTIALQAQGAWTPLGVVNAFDIALDIEIEE
jgi:hypothetical protein